jgi:Protein of unknown function (DUF1579)
MKHCFAVCVLLTGMILISSACAEAPQGPAKDVPELQVLNHYVGKWDVAMTVKPGGDQPKVTRKAVATTEWVLDGRFVQQTGTLEPSDGAPGLKLTTLMTYDPRKKVYRSWTFGSDGFTSDSEGTWDEKARTMMWTSRGGADGATTATKAAFAGDGTESWSIVTKDREGKVVHEMSGKNTRRKE